MEKAIRSPRPLVRTRLEGLKVQETVRICVLLSPANQNCTNDSLCIGTTCIGIQDVSEGIRHA